MIEPVAWIGQDAFAALLGGETICQTMTPNQAMYDDVPLTVIPPGFAIVPVEPTEAMIEAGAAAHASILHGSCLTASDLASKLYKAMLTAAAKGE